MIFLWSTSNRLGSRLIRWGRGDDCSHFAICFDKLLPGDCQDCWLVAESRLEFGVKPEWMGVWKKKNRVVHALEWVGPDIEAEAYQAFVNHMAGREYDKAAVSWLVVDSLLIKLGIKNPYDTNKWGARESVYCQEVLGAIRDILSRNGVSMTVRDLEMLDPHDAYAMLVTSNKFKQRDL